MNLQADIVLNCSANVLVERLCSLSATLRPNSFSHDENVRGIRDRIDDVAKLRAFIQESQSGFFLFGVGIVYSVRIARNGEITCTCFMESEPSLARQLLMHLSALRPRFGFACLPAERDFRNRIAITLGINKMEIWVGRDLDRQVPGLYWLTLLAEGTAERHGLSLAEVSRAAIEHDEPERGMHLFRFYDSPGEWRDDERVRELMEKFPGVFDVERARSQLKSARTVTEAISVARDWR